MAIQFDNEDKSSSVGGDPLYDDRRLREAVGSPANFETSTQKETTMTRENNQQGKGFGGEALEGSDGLGETDRGPKKISELPANGFASGMQAVPAFGSGRYSGGHYGSQREFMSGSSFMSANAAPGSPRWVPRHFDFMNPMMDADFGGNMLMVERFFSNYITKVILSHEEQNKVKGVDDAVLEAVVFYLRALRETIQQLLRGHLQSKGMADPFFSAMQIPMLVPAMEGEYDLMREIPLTHYLRKLVQNHNSVSFEPLLLQVGDVGGCKVGVLSLTEQNGSVHYLVIPDPLVLLEAFVPVARYLNPKGKPAHPGY